MKVIILKEARLNGRTLKPGKKVDINDDLFPAWKRLGYARQAPEGEKDPGKNEKTKEPTGGKGNDDAAGEDEKKVPVKDGDNHEEQSNNTAGSGASKSSGSKEPSTSGRK